MPYKSKKDQAAAARRHYGSNATKVKRRAAASKVRQRDRNKRFLVDYLRHHPCVDCGEPDPVVLEFDHVRGLKAGAVTRMAHAPVGLDRLREEISKCEVRCANCHRRRTVRIVGGMRHGE